MADAAAASKPAEPNLDLLVEDDEFEEFEPADFQERAGAPDDARQFEEDWDDDDVSDDFSKQLRAELEKQQ